MIKKILLAGSVLSLAFAANATESEVYVIKDGKMSNCEFVPSSAPENESTIIKESKNDAGDDMVEIINAPEKTYTSGLLYLPQEVDLNKTWILEVEYYFNKDIKFSGECLDREGLAFDLMADTTETTDSDTIVRWKTNNKQPEYRISHVSIDCSMRDFYDYVDGDSVFTRSGVGKLRTVRKYVYSSMLLPKGLAKRGDANKVKAMFVSFFAPSKLKTSCFIKNLKFVSDGTKPFYADKFTSLASEGTIHAGSISNYVYGTYGGNTEVKKQKEYKKRLPSKPTDMYGSQLFVAESDDAYGSWMSQDRMYCKMGEQRSVGFFDSEYGFLPYTIINKPENKRDDKNGITADAVIRVPFGTGYVSEKISIAMRLGHNAGETGDLVPYSEYKASSKDNERFPVEYRFESGDGKTISNYTEWKNFRPTYTKDSTDYVDSIPTMMSMVYGDVKLPEGKANEYSYIALRFVSNDVISYMFTDLTLTGDLNEWPKSEKALGLEADFAGFVIPVALNTAVENIVAKGQVSIYPNPATDVITVTNEGVKSVAVYSLAGSLVASSESNVVNVANLVNGIYVVKANTEAGVITGQIIKK